MRIENREIGKEEPTFIIAEIGSNHDRKLSKAKELIDVASWAGADAVKFQVFKAAALYPKDDPYYKVFKDNELPREWIPELKRYAEERSLIFLASVFDKDAVDVLHVAKVPAYKIASAELVNFSLLKYTAAKMRPMILSTGMSNLSDIDNAVDTVYSIGNREIILLHCTSIYPTLPLQVNLYAMKTMMDGFNLPVGFSDHTMSITTPVAAVAMGACVIEKHITLSRGLKGPDHQYALEPDEFKQMVKVIREAEDSFGSPIKKVLPEEHVEDSRRGKKWTTK